MGCPGCLDYGYGLFSEENIDFITALAQQKVVAVDSRYNIGAFKGVTLVNPNQAEAERYSEIDIVSTDTLHAAWAANPTKTLRPRAALITQGNKGMTLFEEDKVPYHIRFTAGMRSLMSRCR